MMNTEINTTPHHIRVLPSADCESVAAEPPVIHIRPVEGWQVLNLRELWRYRELLYFLVWRDVKVRYKQTALGAAWAILQPALMMVVFTVFFGRLAHVDSGGLPYPLFAFLGLLPWTFFATAIASASAIPRRLVLGEDAVVWGIV